VFRINSTRRQLSDGILIILREGQKKMAMHVDHIIGQEQVVIRSIKENAGAIEGIAGATIMGDGQVVTILDVSYLFRSLKSNLSSFSMV
jgi:two-component system chemotaxis sensor kinase CheA